MDRAGRQGVAGCGNELEVATKDLVDIFNANKKHCLGFTRQTCPCDPPATVWEKRLEEKPKKTTQVECQFCGHLFLTSYKVVQRWTDARKSRCPRCRTVNIMKDSALIFLDTRVPDDEWGEE